MIVKIEEAVAYLLPLLPHLVVRERGGQRVCPDVDVVEPLGERTVLPGHHVVVLPGGQRLLAAGPEHGAGAGGRRRGTSRRTHSPADDRTDPVVAGIPVQVPRESLGVGGGIGTGEQPGGDVVVLDPGLDGRDRLVEVATRVQMQRVGDVVAREHEGLAGVQPDTDNEDAVREVVVIGGDQVGSGVAGELLHRVVDVLVVVGEDHVVQLGDHRGNLEPLGIPDDPGLVPGAEHRVRVVDHHVRLFGRREPGRILHDVRGLLRDGHRLGDSEGRPPADQGGGRDGHSDQLRDGRRDLPGRDDVVV